MVPVSGLIELVLEVASLERAEQFYHEALGLPVVERWGPPRPAVWLAMGRHARLGLWPPETGGPRALHGGRGGAHVHFALGVTRANLERALQDLRAKGCDAEGPVHFDEGDASIYVTDPDGNVVELWDADLAAQYGL